MKIEFLSTATLGLRWMTRYYSESFPEGYDNALEHYHSATALLCQNPHIGTSFGDFKNVRELQISKIPFSILYAVKDQTIFVIDIRDQRGMRSDKALQVFNEHIRKQYGL